MYRSLKLTGPSVVLVNMDGDLERHCKALLEDVIAASACPSFDIRKVGQSEVAASILCGPWSTMFLLFVPRANEDPFGFECARMYFNTLPPRRKLTIVPVVDSGHAMAALTGGYAKISPFYLNIQAERSDKVKLLACLLNGL